MARRAYIVAFLLIFCWLADEGRVWAIDLATGARIGEVDLPSPKSAPVCVVDCGSSDAAVIATEDSLFSKPRAPGALYAWHPRTGALRRLEHNPARFVSYMSYGGGQGRLYADAGGRMGARSTSSTCWTAGRSIASGSMTPALRPSPFARRASAGASCS